MASYATVVSSLIKILTAFFNSLTSSSLWGTLFRQFQDVYVNFYCIRWADVCHIYTSSLGSNWNQILYKILSKTMLISLIHTLSGGNLSLSWLSKSKALLIKDITWIVVKKILTIKKIFIIEILINDTSLLTDYKQSVPCEWLFSSAEYTVLRRWSVHISSMNAWMKNDWRVVLLHYMILCIGQ